MTRTAILVCRNPHSSSWQLGSLFLPNGRVALVGWRQVPAPMDDGVPADVAMVMARAFTSVARVTFLCTTESNGVRGRWTQLDEEFVRPMRKSGLAGFIRRFTNRIPRNAALKSTRRPEIVLRLFEDPAFPWWMQGQVVLLSAPEAAPPELDGESVIALLDNDNWSDQENILSRAGILGMVHPGVDGDVAGLFSLTPAFEADVLSALESETVRAGFESTVLPEDDFRDLLAGRTSAVDERRLRLSE